MIATLTGLACTGKGTRGRLAAKLLGLDFMTTGDIFRKIAEQRGISPQELEQIAKLDESVDKEVDAIIGDIGRTQDDLLIDGRVGWYFIPDSLKILLECDDCERFDRIAKRDGKTFMQARRETLEREAAIRVRYQKWYSIDDFTKASNFDVIINTTGKSIETGVQEICDAIIPHLKTQFATVVQTA